MSVQLVGSEIFLEEHGRFMSNVNQTFIVAIDGPAGSGKSSICREVCRRLNWSYVNTGLLYRAVGLIAMREGVTLKEGPALLAFMRRFAQAVSWQSEDDRLLFQGDDITDELTSNQAGQLASSVAKIESVRQELLSVQRQMALSAHDGVLVDGRDIGTVVFPDAPLKIYLTASLDERARRRQKQLSTAANDLTFEQLKDQIQERDERDSGRGHAPLKQAADAYLVDTSDMDLEATVTKVLELIEQKKGC